MNFSGNKSPNGDSLDQASQNYSRGKSGYSNQSSLSSEYRHDLLLKNLYRQQLDDIMKQKNEQKRLQKEREMQEKQQYNERVNYGKEAEKMKDLSYKNYYQMLLNNQNNIAKNHVQLNYERDNLKDKLIQDGIEQEKKRSDQWWEAEQKRLDNIKKSYRSELDGQLNEKNFMHAQQNESRVKQQEEFKKITFTPQEVANYERTRRQMEMSKYKEDLDKLTPQGTDKFRVMAGTAIVNNGSYTSNDFNIHQQRRHDPMINPLPYNIQNPYILRQFLRKQQARQPQNNIFNN